MKRADLIKFVEASLEEIGFKRGTWLWQPRSSELYIILGEQIKAVKLKVSMTKRALTFEMGRLAGLAEAAGIYSGGVEGLRGASLNGSGGARRTIGAIGSFSAMPS